MDNINADERPVDKEEKAELSDYEKYCMAQADLFDDEVGDRCFPEMAEGQFVRGH